MLVGPPCRSRLGSGWSATWVRARRLTTTVRFVWVRVLGSSQVALGDDPADTVELGARKPRSVLAALALRLGSELSPDALVDLVWGEDPPPGAHGTLHSYLSGVRRVLEPGLGPRQKPTVLLTSDHGYRLDLPRAAGRRPPVRRRGQCEPPRTGAAASQFTTGPTADWPDRATVSDHVDRLEGLLGLWSGEAYADLPDHPDVALERSSLEQLRRGAEEDRVLGLLALGDHAVVVAATEQATARYPLQERVWALHALALARSGRQADSLAALRQIRGVLADELGLDPGQELRDLERAVLGQDARAPGVAATRDRARPRSPPLRASPPPAGAPSAASGRWPPSRRCSTGRRPVSPRSRCWSASRASASRASSRGWPRPPPVGASWSRPVAVPRTTAPRRCGRGARRSTTSAGTTGASWTWSWSACSPGPRATRAARSDRASGRGRASRARCSPVPRRRRCSSCSRTCTGPTPAACGCCAG